MTTLTYRVHSVVPGTQMQVIEFEGQSVEAAIPNIEVELAWDRKDVRDHGSLTLRFVGADMVWAKDTFVQDAEVNLSFEKVAAEEKEPAEA